MFPVLRKKKINNLTKYVFDLVLSDLKAKGTTPAEIEKIMAAYKPKAKDL